MMRDETAEARGAERRRAMAPSTLRARNFGAIDVTVVDLSASGVRIATGTDLVVGEQISIGLSGVGARRAYVTWKRDGEYGCAFEQLLEPDEHGDAFAIASVLRLGALAPTGREAAFEELRGAHRWFHFPPDAVLFMLGYALLFGWIGWRLARLL